MDCAIVRRGDQLQAIEPRRVKCGELVLTALDELGSEGVVVHSEGFLGRTHGANEFQFMGTDVSRERPVNDDDPARRLQDENDRRAFGVVTNAQDFRYIVRTSLARC